MVRPPKIRHSKARRDPVTIDLDPSDVTREPGDVGASSVEPEPATSMPDSGPVSGPSLSAPDPEPTWQEAAMTKKATEETVAAEPSTPVEAGPTASAKPDDARSSSSPFDSGQTAAASTKPVFGRDASASASASSSTSPSRPTPSQSSRPATGPTTGSGGSAASAPKRSAVSLVAAGVIGGFVVLAGAGALQYAGVLPSPGSSVDAGEPAGLADLRAELAALRDQVAAAGSDAQPDAADTARLDEMAGTVEQLRSDVADLRSAISQGQGGDAAGLQALDQRLAQLETTVASLGQNAGAAETVDLAPLTDRVGAVESRLAEVASAAQAASDATSGLPDRVTALDERLVALDTRVGELAARLEEQASNPRIALAIAAAGLKAAIDRGDPFMTELETYASIAPDAPEIADLRGLAASGVPTRAAISQDVNAAANSMIAAAAPTGEEAGFFGRLLDSMQSVVKVRPIGDVEGDDVGAIVARLEAAVRAGDYARAVGEYETLPEPARQAGAAFIASVKARQTADTLVERALSAALRPQEG